MAQWSIAGLEAKGLASVSEFKRRRPNSVHRIFGRDCKSFRFLSLEVSGLLLNQAGLLNVHAY